MESVGIIFCYILWIVAGRLWDLTVAVVLEIFLWSRGVENLSVILCYTVICVLLYCGISLSVLSCPVKNGFKKEV